MNFGVGSDPHHHVAFVVEHGASTAQVPAVTAVFAIKPVLDLEILTGVDRLLPMMNRFLDVIGMDELQPGPASDALERSAGKLHPLVVKVLDGSCRRSGEDLLRHRLRHEAKSFFTL